MVTAHKLHKLSGLGAGVVLFILAFSGFILDHDYWRVLYSISFDTDSKELLRKEQRLITSKVVTQDKIIIGSMRGVYEKNGDTFQKTLSLPTMALFLQHNNIYAATTKGIFRKRVNAKEWQLFGLANEVITALSGDETKLVAVVDKKEIVLLNYKRGVFHKSNVQIESKKLADKITLSRFLRDLHYGRGLFDDGVSLLLNDYAAVVLVFLALSGYIIWYFIFYKKAGKKARILIKLHANSVTLFASLFLFLLGISGIYLDHASFFGKYTKEIQIDKKLLPPVYSTLKEDIWSVALYKNRYYIGNRVGVYASDDLHKWELVSPGFGYSLSIIDDKLYIGGMGAPNRVCQDSKCSILTNTPHMFKEAYKVDEKVHYLSSHTKDATLPNFTDISLYTLMLSLHDGSFFASWWKWINNIASVLLFVLIGTGGYRWWHKKRKTNHKAF